MQFLTVRAPVMSMDVPGRMPERKQRVRDGHEDGAHAMNDTNLLDRVRGEFLEMPGLRLIPMQAARLWSIDPRLSTRILDGLVEAGFLCKTREGAYLRVGVGG